MAKRLHEKSRQAGWYRSPMLLNVAIGKGISIKSVYLKTDSKKIPLTQKYTTNKKFTILVLSSSNLVKMVNPWVGKVTRISAKSD